MKNGKRPTRKQKILIKQRGLNPENWLVMKNLPKEMHIVHRVTGKTKVLVF